MNEIKEFRNEFFWLSNFYLCEIPYKKLIFPSVENAFQFSKIKRDYISEDLVNQFINISPSKAKHLGRKVKLKSNWDNIKLDVMRDLIRIKFEHNIDLKKKLINTGNSALIEGNNWGDRFWGVYRGKGQNNLGKIIMEIRENLIKNF